MSYGTSRYSFYQSHSTEPAYYGTSLVSKRYNVSSGYGLKSSALPDKYSSNRYYNGSSTSSRTLLDRHETFNSSKSGYTDYTSSRSGRTETKSKDVVRPSMRSRQVAASLTRDYSSPKKSSSFRDSSVPRTRKTNGFDYPELSNTSSRRASPPARSTRPARPEFQTITADYGNRILRKDSTRSPKSYDTSNGSSHTSCNGTTDFYNGYSTKIEVERSIHKPNRRISVDEPVATTKSYSPSYAQNRTSNNNKDYDDGSGSSSRSSTSSKRDETLPNGNTVSSLSGPSRVVVDANAGLVGLKNIGNTCFMNSILQCLSNTEPLRDYCLDKKYMNEINRSSSPAREKLVEAFSDVIRQLWHPSSSSGPVSTSSFKSKIQKFSTRFSGYEQQDSQEFLRFLIEGLHEDVNRVAKKHKDSMPNFDSLCDDSKARKAWDFYLSKDDSYIVDLFMGQLKSSLICAECEHVSTTFDPFWDLSLPIPKGRGYSSESISLKRCIDNFTKEEILDGDERPTCDRCKGRRRMTKKFTIYKFPRILVIHLKRFNEGQRYRQKLSNEVDFPHKLEISSPASTPSATYNLYAVSNHSGSCYGGHYTAYCKNCLTGKWYAFNDSLVSAMSQSSVQSKEAYVLFYELSTSSRSRSHL